MTKIAAIGDINFTKGFELVGAICFHINEIEKVLKQDNIGILIIKQEDLDKIPLQLKVKMESSIKPVVVSLDENIQKTSNLNSKIKKALGIDI